MPTGRASIRWEPFYERNAKQEFLPDYFQPSESKCDVFRSVVAVATYFPLVTNSTCPSTYPALIPLCGYQLACQSGHAMS